MNDFERFFTDNIGHNLMINMKSGQNLIQAITNNLNSNYMPMLILGVGAIVCFRLVKN